MFEVGFTQLGVVGGIIVAVGLYTMAEHNKFVGLWILYVGLVIAGAGVVVHLHKVLSESNHAVGKPKPTVGIARAYISIFHTEVSHPVDTAPTMVVVIKNTGKTPAYDLTWRLGYFTQSPADADKLVVPPIPATKQTLPPDGTLSYRFTFETWDPRADAQLAADIIRIYCVGEIRFKDEDGVDRFVDYRLMSGGRFAIKSGIAAGAFGVDTMNSN